jgi:hypothetical protein
MSLSTCHISITILILFYHPFRWFSLVLFLRWNFIEDRDCDVLLWRHAFQNVRDYYVLGCNVMHFKMCVIITFWDVTSCISKCAWLLRFGMWRHAFQNVRDYYVLGCDVMHFRMCVIITFWDVTSCISKCAWLLHFGMWRHAFQNVRDYYVLECDVMQFRIYVPAEQPFDQLKNRHVIRTGIIIIISVCSLDIQLPSFTKTQIL